MKFQTLQKDTNISIEIEELTLKIQKILQYKFPKTVGLMDSLLADWLCETDKIGLVSSAILEINASVTSA